MKKELGIYFSVRHALLTVPAILTFLEILTTESIISLPTLFSLSQFVINKPE